VNFNEDAFVVVKNNALLWCRMCFEERPATFRLEPKCAEMFAHHKGIPPTLSFVKSLSDNVVNTLILHQIDVICSFIRIYNTTVESLVHREEWIQKATT
jgi:hypothetical protein